MNQKIAHNIEKSLSQPLEPNEQQAAAYEAHLVNQLMQHLTNSINRSSGRAHSEAIKRGITRARKHREGNTPR